MKLCEGKFKQSPNTSWDQKSHNMAQHGGGNQMKQLKQIHWFISVTVFDAFLKNIYRYTSFDFHQNFQILIICL